MMLKFWDRTEVREARYLTLESVVSVQKKHWFLFGKNKYFEEVSIKSKSIDGVFHNKSQSKISMESGISDAKFEAMLDSFRVTDP